MIIMESQEIITYIKSKLEAENLNAYTSKKSMPKKDEDDKEEDIIAILVIDVGDSSLFEDDERHEDAK